MKRLVSVLAFMAAATFVFPISEAFAGRRVALVIGMSAYQNAPKLENPRNDAAAMAARFEAAGFDLVDNRRDLGIAALRAAVGEFSEQARDADVAVVYFAGHGIEVGRNNYLIPVDAKLASDSAVEEEALELNRVLGALDRVNALRLVILDACRQNPFARKLKRSMTRGLARVEPAFSDTLVAYAAQAGSIAEDGREAHSPFTTALLNHLFVPGLDIRIALGRVRDEVLTKTDNAQQPAAYGSLGGADIALVPAPSAAQQADETATSRAAYELAARVGTLGGWDAFLQSHQSGLYADLAREQRKKLLAEAEKAQRETAAGEKRERERAEAAASKEREEAAKKQREEEGQRRAAEAERLKIERAAAKKREENERRLALEAKRDKERAEAAALKEREAAARKRREEEAGRKAAEAERLKADRAAAKKREEEERRVTDDAKREKERAEAARLKERQEAAKRERDEEARRKAMEAERVQAERTAAKKREEDERRLAEEAKRDKARAEAAASKERQQAAKKQRDEELQRKAAEAESLKAERAAAKKREEDERRAAAEAKRENARAEAAAERERRDLAKRQEKDEAQRKATEAKRSKAESSASAAAAPNAAQTRLLLGFLRQKGIPCPEVRSVSDAGLNADGKVMRIRCAGGPDDSSDAEPRAIDLVLRPDGRVVLQPQSSDLEARP